VKAERVKLRKALEALVESLECDDGLDEDQEAAYNAALLVLASIPEGR
jgi:hypothetical protein